MYIANVDVSVHHQAPTSTMRISTCLEALVSMVAQRIGEHVLSLLASAWPSWLLLLSVGDLVSPFTWVKVKFKL